MSDRDLTTADGARAWMTELRKIAAERFTRDGDYPPIAYFVITRDERTGEALPEPAIMAAFVASEVINDHGGKNKDRLAVWFRRVARRNAAIGFAFVSETWRLRDVDVKPRGSWENVPGRVESLTLFGEHLAFAGKSVIAHADVTRPKKGPPTLGQWQVHEDVKASGRFIGVLRPPSEAEEVDPARAADALEDKQPINDEPVSIVILEKEVP